MVFSRIRGTRSYALSRVLRQLGCKQVTPQTGDMRKFATDHKDGKVSFAKMVIREWKIRRVVGEKVPNGSNAECSEAYKKWLKDNITGTIIPGPNMPCTIKDVEAESQVLLRRLQEKYQEDHLAHQHQHLEDAEIIRQLRQELSSARQCIIGLDDRMEQQIQTMRKVGHEERAQSTRDYLWENRYFMWHEVNTAKRARISEGSGET